MPSWISLRTGIALREGDPVGSSSIFQPFGRLDAELQQQLAHAAALLRRIELRLGGVVRPEQHVAVVLLRDAQKVAKLRFVAFAQPDDGELHALVFAFVGLAAVRVHGGKDTFARIGRECGAYCFNHCFARYQGVNFKSRAAFSLRISGRTSGLIASLSNSSSQRSGAITG